jgi:3,4-dihydroxy 2-butanone 4-phosphate synthase/GTP cyclohydrolase II
MQKRLVKVESIDFPTVYGDFDLIAYNVGYDNQPNMRYALAITSKSIPDIPLVRIHSECILSEVFKSTHCDCREQLELGLQTIQNEGGILFYLNQEGRGHGLFQKVLELKMQEKGMDTVEASEFFDLNIDDRKYDVVVDILNDMGIKKIKLLTNNPSKIVSLEDNGIKVVERVPVEVLPNEHNKTYLKVKKKKLGHLFTKYV